LAQINPGSSAIPPSIINISIITAIVDSANITVKNPSLGWTAGSAFLEQPIPIDVIYTPIHCGNPSVAGGMQNGPTVIKMFQEIFGFFQNINFDAITFNFSSDFIASTTPTVLSPTTYSAGWGTFTWGNVPWGGGNYIAQAVRTYIPLSARRAHWLNLEMTLSQAMSSFTLAGFGLVYRPVTTRNK
jgi:hypothetical protein